MPKILSDGHCICTTDDLMPHFFCNCKESPVEYINAGDCFIKIWDRDFGALESTLKRHLWPVLGSHLDESYIECCNFASCEL